MLGLNLRLSICQADAVGATTPKLPYIYTYMTGLSISRLSVLTESSNKRFQAQVIHTTCYQILLAGGAGNRTEDLQYARPLLYPSAMASLPSHSLIFSVLERNTSHSFNSCKWQRRDH